MRTRGQSMVYAVVLLPTLLLVFLLATEVASLRIERARLHWAAQNAAVAAATATDPMAYRAGGVVRIEPRLAILIARDYLRRNLATAGDRSTAAAIAAGATVVVVNDRLPARDPFGASLLDRPAVSLRILVPYRTGLLQWLGEPPVITMTITAVAEVRS